MASKDELHVYDFSQGKPGAANLKAAGAVGVVRYLRKRNPSIVNVLDAAEYADNRAHGLGTALVYEDTSGSRSAQGGTAGGIDAAWARQQAEDVGITPRCIFLATDFDADPDAVKPYYEASRNVLGNAAGAYGGYRVIKALFDWGLISWGWQTAAWSDGLLEPRAHLYQRVGGHVIGGITCDQNVVLALDWGQHPGAAVDPPTPPPDPNSGKDLFDMTTLFGIARTPDGSIYKINYLAGNYQKIPNPALVKEVVGVLERNYQPEQWHEQFNTPDMDRFGVEIGWGKLS